MAKTPQAVVEAPPPADPALLTPPDELNFDQMFADLTKPDEPVPPVAPKPAKPTKVEATPPPAETTPPPVEPTPPVVDAPLVETPRGGATDEDILARFAELVESRKQDVPARIQEQPRPPTPPTPVELFSAEEKTALATFEKDWPDVAKAVAVRERALAQQLVGYMFTEVANTIRPLFSEVRALAERTQVEEIQAREPDYATLRDQVISWIDQQPPYLKQAYSYVRDHGTADEVHDLIQRYKQAAGAVVSPTPTPPPAPRREEALPPAAQRAVAALAPVGSKRSVVIQGDDPSNFDAAFDTFAKSL